MNKFVNRSNELSALESWWSGRNDRLAMVWGRRRVGKTWLIQHFAANKRLIFHTGGGRSSGDELALLSRRTTEVGVTTLRDLTNRPFTTWDDALDELANAAKDEPLLLVLDEFPELTTSEPALAGIIRAFLDHVGTKTKLRILLCGSAVRTMEALQAQRAPLYGRFDLSLQIHPFTATESTALLPKLSPSDRALVWGILGGIPMYLSWWEQEQSIKENLQRLVCSPGARLLTEGQLILATEAEAGAIAGEVLSAIALGKTKHNELATAIKTEPSRSLERLLQLRLIERLVPVTEDSRKTKKRLYRISDNFLAFWLGLVDRYRTEIDQGMGAAVTRIIYASLDDFMGPRWEEAVRQHLRSHEQDWAKDVLTVGSYWKDNGEDEIDIVMLNSQRKVIAVGEAKWTKRLNAPRIELALAKKAQSLPDFTSDTPLVIAAREHVENSSSNTHVITANDIFG